MLVLYTDGVTEAFNPDGEQFGEARLLETLAHMPPKAGPGEITGAVLSVFGDGRRQLRTPSANIGIRGTAVYLEVEPSRTYVCTCYGEAVLEPRGDPAARETVRTLHHEQPRYIMAEGAPQMIMRAPVVNHTDAELVFLESLVGREPPFVGKGFKPY